MALIKGFHCSTNGAVENLAVKIHRVIIYSDLKS